MLNKRPTLKDIAAALNVSTTTISRALNNKDDISEEMRNKVWQVAKMMDYKPNALARSLRQKSSNKVIGVIIPEVDHYFFSTIIKGITMSSEAEYLIMIGETRHDPVLERTIIDRYMEHFVGGIILIPTKHNGSIKNIRHLQEANVSHILVDRTFGDYQGNYIKHDSLNGARQATDHLIKKGRKRIAILKGDVECTVSNERVQGYKNSLEAHGISIDEDLIQTCPNASKEEAIEACQRLFKSHTPPDAIFTITDLLAAGVYEFAADNGIAIPKDISITGYSNSEISDYLKPKLTTVAQDGFEIGQLAKSQIIKILNDPNYLYRSIIPSPLIIRESS